MIKIRWNQSGNAFRAHFSIDIYVFVLANAPAQNNIGRATQGRIQQQRVVVQNYLENNPDIGRNLGPLQVNYMEIERARGPADAPVVVPNNSTFNQLNVLDNIIMDEAVPPEYVLIRVPKSFKFIGHFSRLNTFQY